MKDCGMPEILIVDDNADIRGLWSEALSERGFKVRVAPCGYEAVRIAGSEPVDVVVIDLIMPDKDGIETLLETKAVRPQARILVVSGGGAMIPGSYVEIAKELGAHAALQKPVDIEHFCEVVSKLAASARKDVSAPTEGPD